MDNERFNDLAKAVATGVPRRRILTSLAGGVAGALLGAVGLRAPRAEALAKCRRGQKRCGLQCIPTDACCPSARCVTLCVISECAVFNGDIAAFAFNQTVACEQKCESACCSG